MEVLTAYETNVGNVKKINQDSLSVKVVNSPRGKLVFAVVCDGMGGLEQGELASKETVLAFHNWFASSLAELVAENTFSQEVLFSQWQALIERMNQYLGDYATQKSMMMGTTVSLLLIYQGNYYICHVGDSRIYQVGSQVTQLTCDHSLVAQEVAMGLLTQEEAQTDPRRSILLQCVGASEVVEPQYESGTLPEEGTFLLSSDGFVHMVSDAELLERFRPGQIRDKEMLAQVCRDTVELVMQRGEKDNITVVAVVIKK
jgi:serine/threonine protein phosphatase PrpC